MLQIIRKDLARKYNPKLIDELLEAYTEAKRHYYLGGLRLSEVEGGRFCEAALRMLQQRTNGTFTPLGKKLDTDGIIIKLSNLPSTTQPDSIRLHLPRAMRVIYDIRNKRDAAHLADGIDPNLQDATMVIAVLDWVLAEFVRLDHVVPANEALKIVEGLVARKAPAIQDFQGYLKVLKPKLSASNHLLLLLYHRGKEGATLDELKTWARPSMRLNLRRTLSQLTNQSAYVHLDGGRFFITATGILKVERDKLIEMTT